MGPSSAPDRGTAWLAVLPPVVGRSAPSHPTWRRSMDRSPGTRWSLMNRPPHASPNPPLVPDARDSVVLLVARHRFAECSQHRRGARAADRPVRPSRTTSTWRACRALASGTSDTKRAEPPREGQGRPVRGRLRKRTRRSRSGLGEPPTGRRRARSRRPSTASVRRAAFGSCVLPIMPRGAELAVAVQPTRGLPGGPRADLTEGKTVRSGNCFTVERRLAGP
jgi:hypothetical protein